MSQPFPTRTVAGLAVPLPLAPRIIEAFRGTYPTLTQDIEDGEAAVRAALKHIVTVTLANWEESQATVAEDEAIAAVREDYHNRAAAARAKALSDASYITDAVT